MSARYNRFVASALIRAGYTDIKLLSSNDNFGVDIIAVSKNGHKVCIKCCYGIDVISVETIEISNSAKQYYQCDAAMIIADGVFSDKAQKKAAEYHIYLKENFLSEEMRKEQRREDEEAKDKIQETRKKRKGRGFLISMFVVLALIALYISAIFVIDFIMSGPAENKEVTIEEINLDSCRPIESTMLYQYHSYLEGEEIYTIVVVRYINESDRTLTTYIGDAISRHYLEFKFDSLSALEGVKEDMKLTIKATVGDYNANLDQLSLTGCHIIGLGTKQSEISDARYTNIHDITVAIESERLKLEEEEKRREEERLQQMLDYKESCEVLSYSDVARTPEEYKGKKVKVYGKVIQVLESYLNSASLQSSVTLRICESGDSDAVWYVTYTRQSGEPRILEEDWITCYGECKGVETYTTIFGSSVTIPAMKMSYYD